MIRSLLAAACLLALASPAVAADDVHVTASVLPHGTISDMTQVRLVIRIEGSSIPDVASPKLPPMKNLRLTGGPSTARNSSYSFDNGRISSSTALSLTYFLVPSGTGPAVCSRASAGETTIPLPAAIGRALARSRRVKNALKVANDSSGSAASPRSTP